MRPAVVFYINSLALATVAMKYVVAVHEPSKTKTTYRGGGVRPRRVWPVVKRKGPVGVELFINEFSANSCWSRNCLSKQWTPASSFQIDRSHHGSACYPGENNVTVLERNMMLLYDCRITMSLTTCSTSRRATIATHEQLYVCTDPNPGGKYSTNVRIKRAGLLGRIKIGLLYPSPTSFGNVKLIFSRINCFRNKITREEQRRYCSDCLNSPLVDIDSPFIILFSIFWKR